MWFCVCIWVWERGIRYIIHVDIGRILHSCKDLLMTRSQDGKIVRMTEICTYLYQWRCYLYKAAEHLVGLSQLTPGVEKGGMKDLGASLWWQKHIQRWQWVEIPYFSKVLLKVWAMSLPLGAISKSQWKPSGLILASFLLIIKGTSMGWMKCTLNIDVSI